MFFFFNFWPRGFPQWYLERVATRGRPVSLVWSSILDGNCQTHQFPFYDLFLDKYFKFWVFLGRSGLVFFFASGDLERRKRYTSAYWVCWLIVFLFVFFCSNILKSSLAYPVAVLFHSLFGFSVYGSGMVDIWCSLFRHRSVALMGFGLRESPWMGCGVDCCLLGSLVNRESRPFALKLCCFDLMCRWSTVAFDCHTRWFDWIAPSFCSISFWALPESVMQCMIVLWLYFLGICHSHYFSLLCICVICLKLWGSNPI